MTKGFVLALIILAVLAASLGYLVEGEGGFKELPRLLKKAGGPVKAPKPKFNIPPEFQSGDSRFSQGTCTTDAACAPSGCSGEVCSSSGDVVSTCEFSESFPNVQGYSCTCLAAGVCGWR